MKNIIKLEEAAMFAVCLFGLYGLHAEWYWYIIILFGPDISMIGYLLGSHVGAGIYNIFHHKGIAAILYLSGIYLSSPVLMLTGLLLFAHSSFDRMLGYGLKYNDNFKNTHLGAIGKAA